MKPDVVEYGGDRVREDPLSRIMPSHPDTAPELIASTRRGSESMIETFDSPRQHRWLFLLPFSVAADATIVTLAAPAALCLAMGDECGKLLMGTGNQVSK